jgi:hypothetical protein
MRSIFADNFNISSNGFCPAFSAGNREWAEDGEILACGVNQAPFRNTRAQVDVGWLYCDGSCNRCAVAQGFKRAANRPAKKGNIVHRLIDVWS